MAQAEGYIKERDLRLRRYIPVITKADQVGDTVSVTIQLTLLEKRDLVDAIESGIDPFADGVTTPYSAVGESSSLQLGAIVHLYDAGTGTHALPAAFSINDGGAGTVSAGAGAPFALVLFDTDGKAVLDLVDEAGTSGKTVVVEVTCLYTGAFNVALVEFAGA